jgi:hypothetical protein
VLNRPATGTTTSRLDQVVDGAITAGVAVLILIGFATSYRTLRDLAVTTAGYPPWLAPAVPLSFDLGIVVLSLKVARAAREGRSAVVLRMLVTTLSASTVVANAAAATGVAGRLLHAVPPAMFVICFESVVVTARRQALEAQGLYPDPLPRHPGARWILAPRATWHSWRTAVIARAGKVATAHDHGPQIIGSAAMDTLARDAAGHLPCLEETPERPRGRQAELVVAALHDQSDLPASALQRMLADRGYSLSLRTVQRLRSAALHSSRPETPTSHSA